MNSRTRPNIRLRSARFAVGAAVALVACAAFAPAVVAAPGSPGVPSAPTTLFSEDFENGLDVGDVVLLDSTDSADATYTGAGGRTYTADPYWLRTDECNGIVLDASILEADLEATGCTSDQGFDELIQLAELLGDFNGSANPLANHVVSQFTSEVDTTDELAITTEQPIDLPSAGRFLNASLNVAANSCEANRTAKPELSFALVDGVDEHVLTNAPIDVCAMIRSATGGAIEGAVKVAPNRAVLFEGAEAGILVRNLNGGSAGNDYAIDDLRLLDVTPQLDKEFSDDGDTLEPGDVTDLVLTITNTSELSEKTGWSFTDTLPSGLKVAGAATHDCAAATVAATTGATSVAVTAGSLAAGATSCSITVPVSAAGAGKYKNSAHNITSVGLDAPGSTVVSYAGDVAAPDTGVQRASAWQPWAAIGAGLAVLVAMMTRFVAVRRRA